MGNAYPTPGLSGKFYDADMDPLVEVVRDTVGRHDTFALACNAKYYEDMGYPGSRELHGQLQRRARRLRGRQTEGLAGPEPLLQHGVQRGQRARLGRALVAARRLRAAPRDDRPRVRVVGLPRRRRSGERVGPDRRPRPRLPGRASLQRRDRASGHARAPARPHEEDGVPIRGSRRSRGTSSSTTGTGCRRTSTTRARSPSTGPVASTRRSWTCRRCGSSRSSAPTPRR